MRLSEKLARSDEKSVQITLRVKAAVAEQLRADVKGTDSSFNELAGRLLDTAVTLPAWTTTAVSFISGLRHQAFSLIAGELERRIRGVADEANLRIEDPSVALRRPNPLEVHDLEMDGVDLILHCGGSVFVDCTDRPEGLLTEFNASFRLHVAAVPSSPADPNPTALRLGPVNTSGLKLTELNTAFKDAL